jgi:hypothetical protein
MESHIVGHMVGTWLAMFCHVLSILFVPRLAEFEIEFEPSKTPVHQQPEHQISAHLSCVQTAAVSLATTVSGTAVHTKCMHGFSLAQLKGGSNSVEGFRSNLLDNQDYWLVLLLKVDHSPFGRCQCSYHSDHNVHSETPACLHQ